MVKPVKPSRKPSTTVARSGGDLGRSAAGPFNLHDDIIYEIEAKAEQAAGRYGPFASTHEALGVALEEWDELRAAVHANKLGSVEMECIDLAAVLFRLARACRSGNGTDFTRRSVK